MPRRLHPAAGRGLRLARDIARDALRNLLVELPAELGGQILVASETALGPVRDMFAN